jgi:glyoxylase-like metal-dependent hydrolase (beta-lactamase superfamily II)
VSDWTVECLTVGPLQMNAWLVLDRAAGEAALVDPGDEAPRLLERVDTAGCRLRWLLATHGHFDHVGGAADVQDTVDLPLLMHPDDVFLVDGMPEHQAMYGLPESRVPRLDPSLADGARIPLGEGFLEVAAVPGHAPGHVMFHWPGHALVGDCVFAGSIGRTDLPGGSFDVLAASIRQRIYTLPDATILHPGHGPDTTVAREKATNPFVPGN